VRKALVIAILILIPGCLDTTPDELKGIEILAPTEVIEGNQAEFRAHGVKPNGGKYLWDFGDELGGSGEIVNHVYIDEGQYTITLTVIDGQGSIGVAKSQINILHRNEVPVASLASTYGGQGQTIKVNSIAFFDGGSSSDPDGDVLSFEWNFGDGTTGEGIRPNHFYESVGNFTVTLVVSDNGNLSSTAQTWLMVIIRTYSISFSEQTVTVPALAGYTAEGDTTPLTHNYPYNLTSASYRIQWSEDEDADSEDSLLGTLRPDDFSLSVATNYLLNLTENSTSGEMLLDFGVLGFIPENLVLSFESVEEVNAYLFQSGYTSAKGQGIWDTTITCNNAPSIGFLIDLDDGNDWVLFVEYTYYSGTIIEL
jgi:PKD repeat protein